MTARNLDISLLRTFVAVAERESFTNAAEKVYRTQAAVSQQMQKLEALLGCALFERVGRRKRLTTEGARLLEYARRMVSLNDEAYRAITEETFSHPVRIGVCADALDALLPAYLELCAENFPKLSIDIQVGRSRWLASALRRGDVDLLVRALSMGKLHHAMMGTAAVAIGTAAAIPGTLVNRVAGGGEREAVTFGHPSGTLRVGAQAGLVDGQWTVTKAIMSRSARVLMEGKVRVPAE